MVTCKYCNYETEHKQILTRHIKTKHKDQPLEKEEYQCKYCQKKFISKVSYNRHEQQNICSKNKSEQEPTTESVPPIQNPEIVPEIEFEESPIKEINIEQPSPMKCLLKSPIVQWIKYIGCTLLVVHIMRSKSKS